MPAMSCSTSLGNPCYREPKQSTIFRKFHEIPFKFTTHLHCLIPQKMGIRLMEEIPYTHQLRLVSLPHYLQGFSHHPRWLGMGFLNHQQYQPSRGRSPWPPGLSPQRPGDLDDWLSGGAGVFRRNLLPGVMV